MSYSVISSDISYENLTMHVCAVTRANYSKSISPNSKSTNNVQRRLVDQSERREIPSSKNSSEFLFWLPTRVNFYTSPELHKLRVRNIKRDLKQRYRPV